MNRSAFARRDVLKGGALMAALGLGGCASGQAGVAPALFRDDRAAALAPLQARMNRVFDVTVCLRPFRAAGPRLDAERIGDTLIVHNYGHGGSGWSLAWGSSTIALRKALALSPARIGVVGCGPLGLTSALLAQAAGKEITIYARDTPPDLPTIRATGSFSPDSRIALADAVEPAFPALWEEMARISLQHTASFIGRPGDPVRWIDRYVLSEGAPASAPPPPLAAPESLRFASYGSRLHDLFPSEEILPPSATPFPVGRVRRQRNIMFNLTQYAQALFTAFVQAGGRVVRREFHHPGELAALPEKVVIDCTGYGARNLWSDASVIPVRGQIAWLAPQPEFDYGLLYRGVNVVPRSDGIVVQMVRGGDMRGYNDANTDPNVAETAEAIATLAALYDRFSQARPVLS